MTLVLNTRLGTPRPVLAHSKVNEAATPRPQPDRWSRRFFESQGWSCQALRIPLVCAEFDDTAFGSSEATPAFCSRASESAAGTGDGELVSCAASDHHLRRPLRPSSLVQRNEIKPTLLRRCSRADAVSGP